MFVGCGFAFLWPYEALFESLREQLTVAKRNTMAAEACFKAGRDEKHENIAQIYRGIYSVIFPGSVV